VQGLCGWYWVCAGPEEAGTHVTVGVSA
jgi:hypothetical protein